MKSTFVSSQAVSQALRVSLLKAQAELTADVGLKLGALAGRSVSFTRDLDRLQNIIDTNRLAASRLSTTQGAITQIKDTAVEFMSALMAGLNGGPADEVTLASASDALKGLTTILNTAYNGEYIFAGINTDVQPIEDFQASGSANRAAFDAAFLAHFGFAQTDPAADSIATADMEAFLATIEVQFLGTDWQGTWSNATDVGITSRIALNETVQTSVSANESPFRKLAMASAIIIGTFGTGVGADGRKAVIERAFSLVGAALQEIGELGAKTGILENRVKSATERLGMQRDILELSIQDLEGVDPYEASTRVAAMTQQIEIAYSLTARIQQLSLLNFLR
jgi:flagellar hook-associated protein 3 FlgL